jgi:hypothetical protein
VRAGSFASLRLAKDGWAIAETGTDRWSSVIRGSDPKGPEPLSFSGSAGFREGDPTPTTLVAVGTVEDFLEHFLEQFLAHRGELSEVRQALRGRRRPGPSPARGSPRFSRRL